MRERRTKRTALRRRSRATLLTLVALLSVPAASQEPTPAEAAAPQPTAAAPPPPAGAAPSPPSAPTAIPVGQISQRSQALAERLEEIRALRPTRSLERLEAQLAEVRRDATTARKRAEALLARRHNPSELEAQSRRWQRLDATFERLEERVGTQVDTFGGMLAELVSEAAAWEETLREARRTRAPPVVQAEIRQTLEQLAGVRSQVAADLEDVLLLRDGVRQARNALAPTFQRLALEREEFAAGLLSRQSAPVWHAVPAGLAKLPELGGSIVTELASVWDEASRYARTEAGLLIFPAVLFVLVAGFLLRTTALGQLRRAERPEAVDGLQNPWAAAFLVAVVLVPLLQPERSRAFLLIMSPLALLAWYRLLAGMLPPAMRTPLRGLAVLMGVEVFRFVFIGVSLIDRPLLVLDLTAALAGVVWLQRPERLQFVPWRQAQSPWMKVLHAWMRLGVPALVLGLVAALLGYTNLADCIATLTIFGTVIGGAWLALVRVTELVVESLVLEGPLQHVRAVQHAPRTFLRIFRGALRGFGLLAWAYLTLTRSGLWSPVREAAVAVLSFPLGFGPVAFPLGSLIAFALTLWLSWVLSRGVALLLNEEIFTRVRLPPGVPFALSTLTRYAILVMGFVVALGSMGFTLDRVTLLLSAVGVGIGFGLQNVVNNFVSGMILLFERPIRVGDWVQLDDLFGAVTSIGIRASKMKTFDGADVVVPNADFVSSRVTNWTLSDRKRRMILPVGVAYGTQPRQVLELLEQTARDHPLVLLNPPPIALFRGFGESALNFELRAFTAEDWLIVSSDLYVSALEALQAAGIEIPFPQRDLHLRSPEPLREELEKALPASGSRTPDEPGS